MSHPPEMNLTDLAERVSAAWAYVQKLKEAVGAGASLLENQSARLRLEAACHEEEKRVVTELMLTAEAQCGTHQDRLAYHYRLGNALDEMHERLMEEEKEVLAEIEGLKADAREAQLQANLSNNIVADSLEAVSGLRVELWALQRELTKCNGAINELHQRQWGLEDEIDAVADEAESTELAKRQGGLFSSWKETDKTVRQCDGTPM